MEWFKKIIKKYIFVCIFYYTHHVKNILLDVVCCKNPIKH